MTFKELLEQLQKLSPEELAGKADILDTATSCYYPVTNFYHKTFYTTSGFETYTFIEIRSKG